VRTDSLSSTRVMRASRIRLWRSVAAAVLPLSFGACSWFTDFKRQPAIEPWEPVSQLDSDTTHPPRSAPLYSVPVSGVPAASYAISYSRFPGVIDSFSVIPNPVPVDQRSVDNGRLEYQINCAMCHGMNGGGIGTMAKYNFAISLTGAITQARTDGYLWGMIRNGRGLMPSYSRVDQMDRWDIVNYIRTLQGKTAFKADTTRAGYAGQNGTTVPRASHTAPTVPAPFFKPNITPTPGSLGVNSATYPAKVPGAAEHKENE
jgi:mono/diheme cytochrome c family protein